MALAVKLTAAPAFAWHWVKPNWFSHGALVWNVPSTGGGAVVTTATTRLAWADEPGRLIVSRTL